MIFNGFFIDGILMRSCEYGGVCSVLQACLMCIYITEIDYSAQECDKQRYEQCGEYEYSTFLLFDLMPGILKHDRSPPYKYGMTVICKPSVYTLMNLIL